MTVTAVQITRRPTQTTTTTATTTRRTQPSDVVVVADVESLTATNQRGCGDDNPYN